MRIHEKLQKIILQTLKRNNADQVVLILKQYISLKISNTDLKRPHHTKYILIYLGDTECVTDLDLQREMIIFVSILTTFEASTIFSGSWGSSGNELEPMNYGL